jgi:hypothetical protein
MFHHDPNGGHLDQITKMFDNVDSLVNSLQFLNSVCSTYPLCMDKDCVWPGDFNKDKIVDYRDLLYWSVVDGETGPETKRTSKLAGTFCRGLEQ